MYCGLSASGNGLFCIIPYADPTNHKNVFEAIKNDFEEMGIIIDKSCGDICRLRFLSHDTQPYVNKHAEVYTSKPKTKSNAVEYIYKPKQKYKTKPPKPRTLLIPNAIETFLRPNNFVLESATTARTNLSSTFFKKVFFVGSFFNLPIQIMLIIRELFGLLN